MGIPFPGTLASAANSLLQTMPVPLPSPVPGPSAGPMGGSGAGGGLDSLPRDRSRERERPCKCPPEKGGEKVQRNHNMNPEPRRYQARITGFEYEIVTDGKGTETGQGWNMEWAWLGTDFDGFQASQCLLQEAKGNYDQFIGANGKPFDFFKGFTNMAEQIKKQGTIVRSNPPAKLMWYFQISKTREYMLPTLQRFGVSSVLQP
ncbi:restriction endonuclease fold toxin 5 domain-containing protein [Paraburkholderia unamae]|uniref:Restriction endonuclease fold toxin 5 of polymorphic toxin system n=1 Tax=Paraburkholderia unamae TaxID=219649 RepID=A0ABX5KJM2_9BURK|nr:restriction endonuclease fold toxin 5 domain-containing protein [Paraburkholderia unamae]PVX81826.1 restriction endonuclease fold toxin 5 of polymorphic toxin system [Paraburkholderia unamae]